MINFDHIEVHVRNSKIYAEFLLKLFDGGRVKNIAKKNINLYGLNKKLSAWRRLSSSLSSNFFQKFFDGYLVYSKYMKYNSIKSIYCLIILSCYYLKKRFYEFIYS